MRKNKKLIGADLIGERVSFQRIKYSGTILSISYNNVDNLIEINPDYDIQNYDPVLVSVLKGLSKRKFANVDKQKLNSMQFVHLSQYFLCEL